MPDGTMLSGKSLAIHMDVGREDVWALRLRELNGLFAVVRNADGFCAAAIDNSRLFPLYYRRGDDGVTAVADDAYSLLSHGDVLDGLGLAQYEASGCTFDGHTLVDGVRQIRPGCYVTDQGSDIEYYSYGVMAQDARTLSFAAFDSLLGRVFGRLAQSVGGRQIVVPLSGGQDSRLVLCRLKKLGLRNVVTYTVGGASSAEVARARAVATVLGFEWYGVEITEGDADEFASTDEFLPYCRFIGGLVNFLWLYDYVAVAKLKALGVLRPDAVFLPGHSADFNAGSHMRKGVVKEASPERYVRSAILHDIFEYDHEAGKAPKVLDVFDRGLNCGFAPWSAFQNFEFKTRLPNNINNSARVYEFYGYGVRLPFWDAEFLEAFRHMPFAQLADCRFYDSYVREAEFRKMGVDFGPDPPSAAYFLMGKFRKRVKASLPSWLTRPGAMRQDDVGEHMLCAPLREDLLVCGRYSSGHVPRSANEVMKDWYLMTLRNDLKGLE